MDAGTCRGVQFGNYAYNMSGVTTEQQSESKSNAIQGENHLDNSYNGIEFTNEHYDDYELQDVEIIAIDPDSFYSETTSSSGSSSDSESESGEDNEQHEVHVSTNTLFHGAPFDVQQSNDDFDIITLNIDEEFPIDPQVDDILFKNDHQFDLASYIGGESNSLLLSPVNDSSARRRMISLSDIGHIESHNTPNKIDLSNSLRTSAVQQTNATHDKVAKTPAGNRRKRKNLSREFIKTSDSEDEKETSTIKNSINSVAESSKRNKRKVDDPVWIPNADKRGAKAPKQTAVSHVKQIVDRKDLVENKKATKTIPSAHGNSLRNMLKQQLLSERPMNKGKLLKTMSVPAGATEKLNQPKVVQHPIKRMGVGRGKDIQITAKYYNCNETSDNYDVRDKSCKQDRFHQIYTDSDTSESESSSSESSESDDSDIEVNSEPTPSPKEIRKVKQDPVIQVNSNKEKPRENHFEKKPSAGELVNKNAGSNVKVNITKPTIIDSNSLDSTDFARALVTNAKKVTKAKPTVSKKKSNLEQQKRLIQSNMLLQNPAKFRIFADDKNKIVSNGTMSMRKSKIGSNVLAERKPKPANIVQKLPAIVEKVFQCEKEIKTEQINEEIIDVVNVVEVKDIIDVQEQVKPDVMIVEESKVESSAKRKLNIQEYLKRKSLKTSHNSGASINGSFIVNIKTEKIGNEAPMESNQKKNETNEEASPNDVFVGNSMYEEIIIVSMGCNTNISIPEASFIQPSEMKDGKSVKSKVLLSDIQTSVEKANSKISSMSLISSIQDVILKKTHSIEQNDKKDVTVGGDEDATNGKDKEKEVPEHGENKVIMHLRKDRVRPTRVSTSIQTDPYFQFPPLEKLVPLSKKQSIMTEKRMGSIPRDNRSSEMHFLHTETKNRIHRNYRGPSHLSESSYYSDEDDKSVQRRSRHSDFMEHSAVRHRRSRRESSRYSSSKYDKYISRHRTISRSLSTSSDNSTTSTDSSSSSQSSSSSSTYVSSASVRSLNSYGGSSSKSYYGDDHQYYRIRTFSNNSRRSNYRQMTSKRSNSPEERRIVYVGRIEEETTKEELRRKFSVYGQVKQVSLHYKDSKLKYGFVTFVRPCDAYTAIDDSPKNSAICHYDISFGGRRAFCREKYFDLDNSGHGFREDKTSPIKQQTKIDNDDSFDVLLRKVKEKMQEKK
ncbi:uncharacterized protein LOC129569214 [Sitodiplosis mosellana]|uniref:uncharacterized protein LOC129569214 n=1 Tax=Sitodiplosis mosellana TaxID=263140 RepID=UPI00244396D5|nr:uncharacterized protein LOC129569214 [Sitodiplosis mosellana]XP_055303833.1 uncharacterized protein LOC129569214 [Sitodiplosis mosellana]